MHLKGVDTQILLTNDTTTAGFAFSPPVAAYYSSTNCSGPVFIPRDGVRYGAYPSTIAFIDGRPKVHVADSMQNSYVTVQSARSGITGECNSMSPVTDFFWPSSRSPADRVVVELMLTSKRCAGTVSRRAQVNVRCSRRPVHARDPMRS